MVAMLAGTPSPEADSAASKVLIFGLGGGAFYFVMWIWSHSNIAAAATLSIVICVLDMLVGLITSPVTAGLGIIFKVFFISAMAKAIRAADDEREFTV